MGKTIKIEACSVCKSKDNFKTFEYNGRFISKCMTPNCRNIGNEVIEGMKEVIEYVQDNEEYNYSSVLEIKELPLRGLSLEVCDKLEYYTGIYKRKEIRGLKVYNKQFEHVGWKIKFVEEKKFSWENGKKPPSIILPGLDKALDYNSPLVITEGEEDMLSFWEIGHQACTLIEGAESCRKGLEDCLELLLKYKEIILCFDNDEAGKKAHTVAVDILKNKVKLRHCKLQYKDSNEALIKNKQHLINQLYISEEIRPKGFKFGYELDFSKLYQKREEGISVFVPETHKMLRSFNFGMLYLLAAGASIGKSTFLRQQFKKIRASVPSLGVATIFIEESPDVAPKSLVAQELQKPIGDLLLDPTTISKQKWEEVCKSNLETDKVTFITEDFKATIDNILDQMDYLYKIHGYRIFIIDHLTAIVSNSALSKHGERRDIDEFMEKLFEFTRLTNSLVFVACHLTKPVPGQKAWDEGRVPNMYDLRGSGSLATKPDGIIALVRNLHDPKECDKMDIYILKNRWFHKVGFAEKTRYLEDYGVIEPITPQFLEK